MVKVPQPAPKSSCPRGVIGEVVGSVAINRAPSSRPPLSSSMATHRATETSAGAVRAAKKAAVAKKARGMRGEITRRSTR